MLIIWEGSAQAAQEAGLRKQAVFEILVAVTSAAMKPESTEGFSAPLRF
jgi:hypothetical protein